MTETNLVPGGAHALAGDADGAEAGRTRKLVMFGVLALLVIAAAAYFLLLKGSAPPAPAAGPAPVATVPHAAASPAPSPQTIPASYSQAVGRDPFAPLYVAPVAAPSPSASPSSLPSSTVIAPSSTSVGSGPAASTSSTSGSTASSTSTPTATPAWLELDSQVGDRYATFVVGYTNGSVTNFPNVAAPPANSATTFGGQFALLGLAPGTASVQEGDGQPFTIQQGMLNRHTF